MTRVTFLHFSDYLPFERSLALNLNKFEFPSPKDASYQVWLKLDQWFWRKSKKYEKFTDGRQTMGNQNSSL
jgi:hypothetical protein